MSSKERALYILLITLLIGLLVWPTVRSWFAPSASSVSTTPYNIKDYVVPLLITVLSGGLAGALVNLFATRQQRQTETSLKLIEAFFSKYHQLGDVLGLLEDPTCLNDRQRMNQIREMGDWLDTVALFCKKKYANEEILREVGIIDQIATFCSAVKKAGGPLNDLLKIWQSMKEFS